VFRLILYLILFLTLYWVVKRAIFAPRKKIPDPKAGEDLVRDPVCECYVPRSQSFSVSVNGRKLFFCSQDCYRKYQASHVLPKSPEN
jgi:YHS domain-containing protein